ncbi:MAG: sugar ABC transporter ATP-binding protein [Armatimonadetes bacterium]|nr:sugar ABC transporter ATP-binding protein [Armatimonadota bacterium]
MQFPAVRALDGVSLAFDPGEVHAVIGENGAGKSTLMRILCGLQEPTSGQVLLDGAAVQIRGVRHALSLGIAMIHQELDVVDDLTVAENVFLGNEPRKFYLLDKRQMIEKTNAILKRVSAGFDATTRVADLSIAGKQLVEIAKALSQEASILIMDEPTAVLSDREVESLFKLISDLRGQDATVIYISHRLAEVVTVADRITVLRDGKLVTTLERGAATETQLANHMVGREIGDVYPPKTEMPSGDPALIAKDIVAEGVRGATINVRPGEIVGLAGLIGSGRSELCEAIVGARPMRSGTIELMGKSITCKSPKQAAKHGIAYVSEDRKGSGLVLDMNAIENTTLANLSKYARPLIDKKRERQTAERWQKDLDIRVGDLKAPLLYMSGGNQQKVAIAKWLDLEPKVLMLDEPTRGVDVGAKREIYNLVHKFSEQGLATILISSELPEIIGLCHRVYVMREGRIVGELVGENITEENIMQLAAGVGAA